MGRENRKEAVAAFHREQIMKAAEKLFSVKGYGQTTIEDIAKASAYSRRTIYSYYESKDDILRHIVEKGLLALKEDIENAIRLHEDFIAGCRAIFAAMGKYQRECPYSAAAVNSANAGDLEKARLSDAEKRIIKLGTEINAILAAFIESGKETGAVRQDIIPALSVYILWSGVTSFLSLAQTKGPYIAKQFSVSENELLDYGFRQIINSILEEQIEWTESN